MNKWYLVVVNYTKEFNDGTLKRVDEHYLLNANSFTDAEARIFEEVGEKIRGEFMVKSIKCKNYADLFAYEDTEPWFDIKLQYITEDADSGREKKITQKLLVQANNVKEAYERTEESMKNIMVSFSIPEIKVSKIEDVYIGAGYQESMDLEAKEEVVV